ncbi:AN1-type zinc finger protein 1 isoform X2 [Poeciliopsis prolifica]|uniref:AN1-type zinc finger protein 1 isoform X2 n=1 Tax=Poeciliopsis prolifica TaxID=188132 RepID=UPI002412EEF2|nr:AN1-type zinc finger protein 1 isoform X2 [Poeciliopsis prolifica]
MAELDIGKHCQVDSCNLKDFLPFVCDSCSGVYCLEHRSREAHSCPEETVTRETKAAGSTSYPCSFEDCKGKELLPVLCPQCEKHFCLTHRHQDDHKCEKLEVQKPRMAATKELVQKILESKDGSKSKGRRGAKNAATAAKVALMKLKLHAAGDKGLPQKLRLCHPETGQALQMDDSLLSLLAHPEAPLHNGGNVILEYVDNECTGLKDVSDYIAQT